MLMIFDPRLLGVAWGDRADDAESAGEDVDGAETGCVGLGGVGEADQAVADVLGSEDATEHVEGGQPPAVGRGVVGDFGDRAKGEVDGGGVTDEFIAVEVEVRGVAGHELGAEDFDEIVELSEGLVVGAGFGAGSSGSSSTVSGWDRGRLGAVEQVGELLLLFVGETRQFEVESVRVGWVGRGGHGVIRARSGRHRGRWGRFRGGRWQAPQR